MARTAVCRAGDMADVPLRSVTIGDRQILLARVGGELFAAGNLCTHKGCRLSGGRIEGGTILCPCHKLGFDLRTGKVVAGKEAEAGPLPVFSVSVEGDEIFVEI